MKLKQLLKVVDKDTYLSFENNNLDSLGGCYKNDFKTTFKGHRYLNQEIEKIYAYKVKDLFTDKYSECICIQFMGA